MDRHLFAAATLAAATACSTVASEDVTTDALYADMWVIAEGDGASRAVATLRVGGELSNTFVELSGGDALTATRDGEEPVAMVEQELLGARSYRADFPDDTPDLDVTIALEREVDDGAPASVMSLPQPFALDPIDGAYSRDNDDIVLTWDNTAAEEISVWVEGSCIQNTYTPRMADAGTYTLAADSIQANAGEEAENCEIEISVWRSRPGTVDPGYGKGGAAWGHQVRKLTTVSTP